MNFISVWRDVYLAAGTRGMAALGHFMATTALVLTFQPDGGLAVSALVLAAAVPLVVLAPLTGRLADRVDSRRLLVAAGTGQAVVAVVLTFTSDLGTALVLVTLLGAGQAVTNPTLAALVPAMVARDDIPRANAINQTAHMAGMLAGPAVGGMLVGEYGTRIPLFINALGVLAFVIGGLVIRTRRGGAHGANLPPAGVPSSNAVLWPDPLLRAMVVSLAAVVAAVGAMNVVDVFLIRDAFQASEATYGWLEATWFVGMLSGTWLLARVARRARDDGALVYGLLAVLAVMCATLPAAASVGAAGWLVPLWIVGGMGNGGVNVFANVLVAHRIPDRARGRAYATVGAAVQGAALAGYAAGGPLVDLLPIRPLVAGIGTAGLIVVAMLVPTVVRSVRSERTEAPSSAAAGSKAITC
jgi:MFS family permease